MNPAGGDRDQRGAREVRLDDGRAGDGCVVHLRAGEVRRRRLACERSAPCRFAPNRTAPNKRGAGERGVGEVGARQVDPLELARREVAAVEVDPRLERCLAVDALGPRGRRDDEG